MLVQTQGHRSPISSLMLAQTHFFFPACHHAAVKLIGPQMAGFGITAGFTRHMPLYIMSFALLESPEGACT